MHIGLQWVEKPTLYQHLLPDYFSWDNEFPLPRVGEYLVIDLGQGSDLRLRVDDIAHVIVKHTIRQPTLGVRFVNYTPPVTERTTE